MADNMEYFRNELESWEDKDEFPEAIMLCLICKERPITADHIHRMLSGKTCVCRVCGAIHSVVGGEIGITGFRL